MADRFGIRCPYCRTSFKVERNTKVKCVNCGGEYKVEIKETMPHQEDIFEKGSKRAYVDPVKAGRLPLGRKVGA